MISAVSNNGRDPLHARLRPARVAAWAGRRLNRLLTAAASARRRAGRLGRRLRYQRVIEQMHLAVCTPCQYDCVSCAHQGMRHQFTNYHLPIDELREFLKVTEASGYFLERLLISGPGEPLLWKHLSEGLAIIARSPAIGVVEILTNGLGINRLDERDWQHIGLLRVSLYPEAAHIEPALRRAKARYGDEKITVKSMRMFRESPRPTEPAAIPCECTCPGPMYFDRRVLTFCGPPVFEAAQAVGGDVFDYPEMFSALRPGYLEPSSDAGRSWSWLAPVDQKPKTGDHELCRYCYANSPSSRPRHAHVALPHVALPHSAGPRTP